MKPRRAASVLAACQAAWPGVVVTQDEFLAYVADRHPGLDPAEVLSSLRAEDLYLACACSREDRKALAAFERNFLSKVAGYVARVDRSSAFADEVRQALRDKLFLRVKGKPGKIAEYTGRGSLGAWLRVASVRTALNLKRRSTTGSGGDPKEIGVAAGDPELDYLKARYRKELSDAFRATLEELPADARTVLRMHYIDGLSLDEIGVAYRIHRTTAARWLASSREKILKETRRRLAVRVGKQNLDSVLALAQSELDVTLTRLLERGRD